MPKQQKTKKTETTEKNGPSSSLPSTAEGFLPPHGGYENLLSFQKARIIYDGTVRFCQRCVKAVCASA